MNASYIAALLERQAEIGPAMKVGLWFSRVIPGQEIAVATIAGDLHLTERSVSSHIKILERAGFILRTSRVGRARHSLFTVLVNHE